jgi:hypothetical protein
MLNKDLLLTISDMYLGSGKINLVLYQTLYLYSHINYKLFGKKHLWKQQKKTTKKTILRFIL